MDGDEDLQRGHLGNGKACIDVFSINKEHEMPSDRSGDGTKSAYEPLSIDCEDNDLALYYGLALSLAQGEHWRHNISQPEGKLLHEATCSMQRFKSFWYNPAEFMLKCDLDKGTKVRGEVKAVDKGESVLSAIERQPISALASTRVRELILGELVYILPVSTQPESLSKTKWFYNLNKVTERLYAKYRTVDNEMKSDISNRGEPCPSYLTVDDINNGHHFELDDMYYTHDVVSGFLCESDDICDDECSSSSQDDETEPSDNLANDYDNTGIKYLMSVVRDKFPPDRLNAIRDFFFQIKSSGLKPKQSSSDTQSHNIGKSDPSIASKFNFQPEGLTTAQQAVKDSSQRSKIHHEGDSLVSNSNYSETGASNNTSSSSAVGPYKNTGSLVSNGKTEAISPNAHDREYPKDSMALDGRSMASKINLRVKDKSTSNIIKSSTEFRYRLLGEICRNSPFWVMYRPCAKRTPISILCNGSLVKDKVITRDPYDMRAYLAAEREVLDELEEKRMILFSIMNSSNKDILSFSLSKCRDQFFPEFQFFNSSVPTLFPHGNFKDPSYKCGATLDGYTNTCLSKDNILLKKVLQNIEEHAKIKDLYFRIVNSQCNTLNYPASAQVEDTAPEEDKENQVETKKRGICPKIPHDVIPVLNNVTAEAIMRRTVALMLSHAGFDVCLHSILSAFTDLAVQKFCSIGKTMRTYIDSKCRLWSAEDILICALKDNGTSSMKQLEEHIYYGIGKYGNRLYETRVKLESTYNDLVGNGCSSCNGELKYDEEIEQIASGNFFEEYGIDTLNLRELGVDFIGVPRNLWNFNLDGLLTAKIKPQFRKSIDSPIPPVKTTEASRLSSPSPSDYSGTIGLLKPFYEFLVSKKAQGDRNENDSKTNLGLRKYLSCSIVHNQSTLTMQKGGTPGSSHKNKKMKFSTAKA